MTSLRGWAGTDLGPLPFESSYSILARFAWRNATRLLELMEAIGVRVRPGRSLLINNSLEGKHLAQDFRWEIPSKMEAEIMNLFGEISETFFSDTLRICPACLENSFHTFWHQFLLIETCPLHSVHLRTSCVSCGELLPAYAFSNQLFYRPYTCKKCKLPLCGSSVRLDSHLNLRGCSDKIERSFTPLMSWARAAHGNIDFLKAAKKERDTFIFGAGSLSNVAFLGEILVSDTAFPMRQIGLIRKRLVCLHWRIEMAEEPNSAEREKIKVREQNDLIYSVYCATMRNLRRWIFKDYFDTPDYHRELSYREGLVCIENLSDCVSAYHLTRISVEGHLPDALGAEETLRRPQRQSISGSLAMLSNAPRLAWHAIFLATFASHYLLVQQHRKQGWIPLSKLAAPVDTLVPSVISPSGKIHAGRIIFPEVPNMPLGVFKLSKHLHIVDS